MQLWLLFGLIVSFGVLTTAQYSNYWDDHNGHEQNSEHDKGVNIQVPNFIQAGKKIAKSIPYTEILKLIESLIKLKGQVAGKVWHLIIDNAHIFKALLEAFISKISTIHHLTLGFIIILRKIIEYASSLIHVSYGHTGPIIDKTYTFGKF